MKIGALVAVGIAAILLKLAVIGGGVYVAWHFISKYW